MIGVQTCALPISNLVDNLLERILLLVDGDSADQSVRDQVLEIQIADQNQQQSSAQTQYNALQQVQGLFSNPTQGIGADFTNFFNSISALSTNPASVPDRQAVLTAAQNLAGDFNSTESNLDTIQSGLNQTVNWVVSQIGRASCRERVLRLV